MEFVFVCFGGIGFGKGMIRAGGAAGNSAVLADLQRKICPT
jgi:hypothetical protein